MVSRLHKACARFPGTKAHSVPLLAVHYRSLPYCLRWAPFSLSMLSCCLVVLLSCCLVVWSSLLSMVATSMLMLNANAQCSMLNAQCSMLNAQCSVLNAQCSSSRLMLDARCPMLSAQLHPLRTYRHWLYQSFEKIQVEPAWQTVPPVQPNPPHWQTGRLRTGRLRTGRLRTGRLRTVRLRTGRSRTGRSAGRSNGHTMVPFFSLLFLPFPHRLLLLPLRSSVSTTLLKQQHPTPVSLVSYPKK